jgi:hypothetical protein
MMPCGMIAPNMKAAGNAAAKFREDCMKKVASGIFAAALAMSASAASGQSKPPLKLGGILDMSGLFRVWCWRTIPE